MTLELTGAELREAVRRAVEDPDGGWAAAGVRQHFHGCIWGALGHALAGEVSAGKLLPHLGQGQAGGGANLVRCVPVVGDHVLEPALEIAIALGRSSLGGGRDACCEVLVVREGGVVFGQRLR
ncbi:MAG: hypothetical protein VYC47_05735 [Verrucomicrobiota bacterium]|nr:hypothetical protein [Verrucomicrobiota bacterium]